ncbi:MAG: FemAB family XrtA/PEP-CTERM system-associated protein [Planctomycetota bacterium]
MATLTTQRSIVVRLYRHDELSEHTARWQQFLDRQNLCALSRHIGWLEVLKQGLQHEPYCLEADEAGQTVGLLPLCLVSSVWFGRFLVGLPYLNSGGIVATGAEAADALATRAVELADQLNVRHLELRHEQPVDHPALKQSLTTKVHMRLALPDSADALWSGFSAKVRNQIRKGEKSDLSVAWGGQELLEEFYAVFARNMRDLGTPVFGKRLFSAILAGFPRAAEFCVVRHSARPVAAALLLHGAGTTEVPSASCLREYNPVNANMFMYWHLLRRAIERDQSVFDFGRSTRESNTYRFKKQWGAVAEPAVWQFYVRKGCVGQMRPESGKFGLAVRAWQRLPVPLTRWLGPSIVRGIP